VLRFTVACRPRGKGRPRFGRGHVFTDPETRAAEDQIAWAAKAAGAKQLSGAIMLSIVATFRPSMTESTKAKGKAILGPFLKRPDSDNIIKLVCDALNGVAWVDDAQVYGMQFSKVYGAEDKLDILIEYDDCQYRH
jgi:Holliday junction resolvase RusA-like endonuclease